MKIQKSDYIKISKSLLIKLFKEGCWGKGSLYEDNLKDGFPKDEVDKVIVIADALVRQGILGKKRKQYGFKYFLNADRRDKIIEIIKQW